jgi:4-hydroxy-tetrahydrodipicolinate synthase
MAEIGRLLTAMITPFDAKGGVSYSRAKALAKALMASGSDGLVVSGTTGEAPTLTHDEKMGLFKETKDAVGNKGAIVAGTGNYNTAESIELSDEAAKVGADGLLLTVPYYNRPTQEGLYQHFKTIAESTDLPCIVYNVPSRTATNMTADTTIRLSHVKNIVGVKEASGNMEQVAKIIGEAKSGFRVWSGNDSDTFAIMCMGGYGIISVASHLVGKQIKLMMGLILEGDVEKAAKEHLRLMPIFTGLFIISNPMPVKYAVDKAGFKVGIPRLPLLPPDRATSEKIDALVSNYKIDLPIRDIG